MVQKGFKAVGIRENIYLKLKEISQKEEITMQNLLERMIALYEYQRLMEMKNHE